MRTLILAALLALPAHAATLPATPVDIAAVLASAKPGDTIVLAPGEYGRTGLRDKTFSPALVIQAKGAVLNGWGFSNVTGLAITGGTAKPICPALPCYAKGIEVFGGGNILIDGMAFVGPAIGTDAYGLNFRQTKNVGVSRSTFSGFKVGLVLDHTSDFTVTSNHFTLNRADGIDVAQGWRGTITGNVCDAMRPAERRASRLRAAVEPAGRAADLRHRRSLQPRLWPDAGVLRLQPRQERRGRRRLRPHHHRGQYRRRGLPAGHQPDEWARQRGAQQPGGHLSRRAVPRLDQRRTGCRALRQHCRAGRGQGRDHGCGLLGRFDVSFALCLRC
jgi:hypothetical protein